MPGSFERDIPKKCRSLPISSLQLFYLLKSVLNFSKFRIISSILTISKVIFGRWRLPRQRPFPLLSCFLLPLLFVHSDSWHLLSCCFDIRELKVCLPFNSLIVSLANTLIIFVTIFFLYLSTIFLIRLCLTGRKPH